MGSQGRDALKRRTMLSDSAATESLLSDLSAIADEVCDEVTKRVSSTKVLSERVQRLSAVYTQERDDLSAVQGNEHLEARLRFFLPRDALKFVAPLEEVHAKRAFPDQFRVLDVGAGVGASALGAVLFADRAKLSQISLTLLEPDPACEKPLLALVRRLGQAYSPNLTATVIAEAGTRPPRAVRRQEFDLITFGFVLNEMCPSGDVDDLEAVVRSYLKLLAPKGTLLIVEPALKQPTRALHALRDRLAEEGLVFAPCLGIERCPMLRRKRDWCHEDLAVGLPPKLKNVAKQAGLRFERLTYSYLTLGSEPLSLGADITEETFRAVSQLRKTKGKLELFACGKSQAPRFTRLNRHRSETNRVFESLKRGDLFEVDGSDIQSETRIGTDSIVH